MKIINSSIAVILLLLSNVTFAEKPSEDDLLLILDQSEKLRVANLNKAIKYLEPKKQIFVDSENPIGLTEYNLYLGFYYIAIGKFDIGEHFLDQAKSIIDLHDIPAQQADEIFFRGMLAQKKAEIEKGTELFLKHYDFAEKHGLVTNQIYSKIHLNQMFTGQGNSLGALTHLKDAYRLLPKVKPEKWKRTVALKALVTSSMGSIYANLGEAQKAVELFHEAIDGFMDFNSIIDAGVVTTKLASTYANLLNNHDQARVEFEKVFAIAQQIKNARLMILYYQGIGKLELETGEFIKAEKAFEKSIEIASVNGWQRYINSSQFNMAKVYMKLGKWEAARLLLEKVAPHYAKFELFDNSYEVHNALQQIYFKQKNLDKAYFHQTQTLKFYKINQNIESNKALAKVRTEMDIELKDVRNRLLVNENELSKLNLFKQQLQLKNQNQLLISFFVIILLLLVISFVLLLFSKKLHRQAFRDSMTKLANRRRVFEFGEKELAKAKKKRLAFSVVIFDLDRFKHINDTFGHEMGDKVIVSVSEICQGMLTKNGLMGRIGGEEFILILPQTEINAAFDIAEQMRKSIETYDWKIINPDLSVTSSFGVTRFSGKEKDLDELIRVSDGALYLAKDSGRNNVKFAAEIVVDKTRKRR